MNRQTTDWKKIFAIYIYDKDLQPDYLKTTCNLMVKKINNLIMDKKT